MYEPSTASDFDQVRRANIDPDEPMNGVFKLPEGLIKADQYMLPAKAFPSDWVPRARACRAYLVGQKRAWDAMQKEIAQENEEQKQEVRRLKQKTAELLKQNEALTKQVRAAEQMNAALMLDNNDDATEETP